MRVNTLRSLFLVLAVLIAIKLFYIQVVKSEKYVVEAEKQHIARFQISPQRGEILTKDGFPLVSNKKAYLVYLSLTEFRKQSGSAQTVIETAKKLAPIFVDYDHSILNKVREEDVIDASSSAEDKAKKNETEVKNTEEDLVAKMSNQDLVWVPLKRKIDDQFKTKLSELNISGLGFQEIFARSYPEATLAAQTLGFVGQDSADSAHGYLGLEGYYDGELRGRDGFLTQEVDAEGRPILVGRNFDSPVLEGSTLNTSIDRTVQFIS